MDFWLERALDEIDTAAEGISPVNLSVSPAEGKWSVAQILEHLSLAFRHTVSGLAKVVQTGEPIATAGSFKQWLFTRVVVDVGYFPTGRPAPARTVPKDVSPDVLREIRENLIAMDAILTDVASKLGPDIKVADHPVLGPFTVREWRKFHYRHTHHHMKQIVSLKHRFSASAQGAGAD